MRNSLSLLFVCITFFAQAQLQRNYTSYNVDNGLAQNTVWDALQDSKGYLWLGTADGISRFDGYKMHHYLNEENDTNTIFGTTGFNFYEDSSHQLWIGHDRGLSIYNRSNNTFRNIYKTPKGISVMGVDDNAILWTVSEAKYIYGFDQYTYQLKHTIYINQDWHNSYGSVISNIRIGNTFFIGFSNNAIASFKPQTLAFKAYTFTHQVGTTIHKLSNNRFCSFYKGVATICNVRNDTPVFSVKKYDYSDTAGAYFSGGIIYHKKLLAGGQNGLYVFDEETLEFEEVIKRFTNKNDDSYFYVQTVREDKGGNLLVCSNGAGLYIYSPYRNKFKHFTNYSPKKSLFKAIVSTNNGMIYGGTYGGGITVFSPKGEFKTLIPPIQDDSKTILAIHKISEKELIFVSYQDVFKYTIQTKTYTKLPLDKKYGASAYPYFQRVGDQLWLNRKNKNDAAIFDVFSNKKIFELLDNTITCHQKVGGDTVIVGTKRGVLFFNLSTKKITPTKITDFVKSILVSSKHKIYVGTIVGLYILNMNGEIEQHFSTVNALQNNFIYGVLEDNQANIWFSHNKGISMLNTRTSEFKHYTVKDGLQSNEFNTGAYYKDEKGLLYFGGVNGINVIDPDNIEENKNVPQIGINEILVDDLPYSFDKAFNEIQSINLSYLQNTVSFDFSALEFSQPEDNIYRYKLEGYDNNWIESGNKHFARYANLPPGHYTLKIKAANGDGFWNETAREIIINVKPPYWQTGWFYTVVLVFVVLSVIATVYAFVGRQKARLKRELEVQQKLEAERLRISRDLHDNVGAQLSYLITNVEWMLEHPEQVNKAEEKQRLETLSETGRNAILTLRQTIWAISHSSLTVEDFADRFKQFALKMVEFNAAVALHFSEDFASNKTLSPAVALNVFRICQEAFNNALKHSQCCHIHIRFATDIAAVFVAEIKDDGVGFDWDEALTKGHYGLHNMKARVEETAAIFII
jgi:signal transduction histidine kinase